MSKLYIAIAAALLSCATTIASAQQDADNIAQANKALDASRKCDEAMRFLNLVSTDNRQSPAYLKCIAKAQDCMQNTEQALYYYNKYLALAPADDSVKRRTAELTDAKNRVNRNSGVQSEVHEAKKRYGTAAKRRKHRRVNLDDSYYTFGISYGAGLSDKSPFKSAVSFHAGDGFVIIKNHALIDLNFTSGFLVSPNETWFKDAIAPINTSGNSPANIGTGFTDAFTVGFAPILINTKDIALTAGLIGGINYYAFPINTSDYSGASFNSVFTFCYGIKSNLYIGQNFMVFADFMLNAARNEEVSLSYYGSSYNVPANYNMLHFGIAVKVDSWW